MLHDIFMSTLNFQLGTGMSTNDRHNFLPIKETIVGINSILECIDLAPTIDPSTGIHN